MTMIRKCDACQHEYGLWRVQCPACGATNNEWTDANARKAGDAMRKKERRPPSRECIYCRQGGAKETCPHCDELIHKNCRRFHEDDCKRFQTERAAEIAKLPPREHAARVINDACSKPNALDNPAATAQAILDKLKGRTR